MGEYRCSLKSLVTPPTQAAFLSRPASRGPCILPRPRPENEMSRPGSPPRVSATGFCSRLFQRSGIRDLLRRESHPYDRGGESGQAALAFSPVEATSEPACAGHADRPGIRVAEYCLVVHQWSLLLWPREIDTAPRSCCGLREKTPSNFPKPSITNITPRPRTPYRLTCVTRQAIILFR